MDTSRRPSMPGKDLPPGFCRVCEKPCAPRARAHPECRRAFRRSNVPEEIRAFVFERDRWVCIDCGNRFPPSMLEADHDDELADGGKNDPSNYVTRCLDCHDDKTEEMRMARTSTSAPSKSRNARARATAQLPEKPSGRDAARLIFTTAFLIGVMSYGGSALGQPTYAHAVAWLGAFLVVSTLVSYLLRLRSWKRLCEAQRVFEALAKAAGGLAHATRKQRFKVTSWAGTDPREVTIQYGPTFDPGEPRAWDGLATAFAHAVTVPTTRVQVTRMSKGRARLSVLADEDARASDARPESAQPDVEPARMEQGEVTARVRDALGEVLEGCDAEVTDWHPDGAPARVVVTYPAAATKAARDARADLPVLMADVYAPRTPNGRWALAWESARDRFIFTDSPDPLAPVVPLPDIEQTIDLTVGPVLGVQENGHPWRQPLLHNHVLVAGATGAGKGSVLWGIVRGVFRMIEDGRVRLWVIDPKGGMELGLLEPLAHRFATATDALEVLDEAAEAMEAQAARLRRAGLRKLEQPTVETPLNIVMVDEVAAITSLEADSKRRAGINSAMGKLLTQGRAVGMCVVSALQDPSKETLKNRGLFPGRIGLRLEERTQPDMVLGAGARAAGAVCDMIPRALPGVGFVAMDGRAGYARVRAAFVKDEEIARLATPVRAPEHAQRARTEQLSFDAHARGGEPVAIGEVLADANVPDAETTAEIEPVPAVEPPARPAKPIPVRALTGGEHGTLPQDDDPVEVVRVEPDPDEPDDRMLVTYIYDGETGEREASFERGDIFLPC